MVYPVYPTVSGKCLRHVATRSLILTPMPGPRGSPWTRSLLTRSVSSNLGQADGGVGRGPGLPTICQGFFKR